MESAASGSPVPLGSTSSSEWVTAVTTRHAVGDWTGLTVKQRKTSLLQLSREDKDRFEEVVQYVTQNYSDYAVEDFADDSESLLVVLSTPLAVKVLKNHCSVPFSLVCVPSLMKRGISPHKLEKIIRASKEQIVREEDTAAAAAAATSHQCDGEQPQEQSKSLGSPEFYLKQVEQFLQIVLNEEPCSVYQLDNCCQTVLSLYGPSVNLNRCRTAHGNVLHAAAKYGLAQAAKEVLAQGYYNMLLEKDDEKGISWPLYYAVENKKWSTVKIILETLNFSQRQAQMKVIKDIVPSQEIAEEMRRNQMPWWVWSPLRSEDIEMRKKMEGQGLLLKAVLDTTMQGNDVDPALLLKCGSESVGMISADNGGESTNETDGSPAKQSRKSLYEVVANCNVEEVQSHPCFATVVEHKWRRGYGLIHGLLFVLYLFYLLCFTTSLGLAARSSDPREYNGRLDVLRLITEIASLLYLIIVIVMESILSFNIFHYHYHAQNWYKFLFLSFMEVVYKFFEVLRFTSTLLIIPLRIADNPFQWQVAALAIILSGFRLFRYATVLPYVGSYVGLLILLLRQDVPRLFVVFAVINFSLGSGLYFALVGHYDDGNVDIVNDNSTSEVYLLWLTGVRFLVEGSVLNYTGQEGFNSSGVIIYMLFVFCVTTVFSALLIAQFFTSYNQLAEKAHKNVILKKAERIQKMDMFFLFIETLLTCIKKDIKFPFRDPDKCKKIKRNVLHDTDIVDRKDFMLEKLSRKLAENDKRVQLLEGKLDRICELLEKKEVLREE